MNLFELNVLNHSRRDANKHKIDESNKSHVLNRLPMYEESSEVDSDKGGPLDFASRFQKVVLGNFENFFYNYGKFVARYKNKILW